MHSRNHAIFTIMLFLYMISFLIGRPVIDTLHDPVSREKSGLEIIPLDPEMDVRGLDEPERLHQEFRREESGKSVQEIRIRWMPGLIEQVHIIESTLGTFSDPLLESDAKPERMFRELERALLVRLFTMALLIFWSLAALLLLVAMFRGHWFARPMTGLVITPALFTLLLLLLFPRREDLFLAGWHPLTIGKVLIETILFFAGTGVLIQKSLPQRRIFQEDHPSFLDHLIRKKTPVGRQLREGWTILYQLGIIIGSSLVIANLFLLPLYELQLNFPELFGFLLIIGLAALGVFYVISYVRVARFQNEGASYPDGISFLGYRFLRNTTFLTGLLTVVALTAAVIVILSLTNVHLLQTLDILQKPRTL